MFDELIYFSLLTCFCVAIGRDYSLYVKKHYDFLDHQANLTKDLFAQYDPTVSPVYSNLDYTKPLGYDVLAPNRFNYTLWLYYMKLVEVDEPQEKVTAVLELMELWYDPRLIWNTSSYGDIDVIYVRQERVWSPTVTGFGVNELVDFRDQDFRYVCIENMGRVSTYLSVKIAVNCILDVSQFPFDTQTCQIKLCLPMFNRAEIELVNEIYQGIDNKAKISTMGNSEWNMKSLSCRVEQLIYNDSFGTMDQSVFEIKFQRNPMYYIYMIVFPSYIINVASIIGVFMKDADRMSKLNVGLTNIMTMTFILGVMADKVPKTDTIPLLGIYIIINLSFMSLALCFTLYLGKIKKWALPKLKNKKSKFSRAMEKFVANTMEVLVAVILELLTTANFCLIMFKWLLEKHFDFLDHQSNLTNDLFARYNPSVSPVYSNLNYSLPIGYDVLAPNRFNYTLWLYYLKLVEVNEPQEKVTAVLELMEFWYDPRLMWNSSAHGDIKSMYVRQSEVWSPTLTGFGVNELVDFRDQDFRYVCIEHMGRISTYLSVKIAVNCNLDVSQFPCDTQTCQIRLCLPLFNRAEIEILNEIYRGINNPEKISTMGNSEWNMKSLTSRIQTVAYNDSFGSMDQCVFEITFQRNPMYYIYMIVFPSYIINVASIIGVFMKDADRMSKLNVGLTNIMTMTFILGVMADKVPKTNTIPLLGIYIIINLSFMSLALCFTLYLGKIKKWALPKLKNKKSRMSCAMETFIARKMEIAVAVILELLTTANFCIIMVIWIRE